MTSKQTTTPRWPLGPLITRGSDPGTKSPRPTTSLFKKKKTGLSGTYSPNGTRWTLSYRSSTVPVLLTRYALKQARTAFGFAVQGRGAEEQRDAAIPHEPQQL